MQSLYLAIYRDRQGEERITIENDHKTLRTMIRGVHFVGTSFDDFEPAADTDPDQLVMFTLASNMLCDCNLAWEMPLVVATAEGDVNANLVAQLTLGAPRAERGSIDAEVLKLRLIVGSDVFESAGVDGFFDDELRSIQRSLPAGWFIKSCFGCAFSDYHPVGFGLFGDLACFRDHKAAFLAVRSKHDFFEIWALRTETIQETYLCPEFEYSSHRKA